MSTPSCLMQTRENGFISNLVTKKEQGANLSNEHGNIFPTDWLCSTISMGTVLREAVLDIILLSHKALPRIVVKCIFCFYSSPSLSLHPFSPSPPPSSLPQQFKWKGFLGVKLAASAQMPVLATTNEHRQLS